ncbi:nucleotide sugar dehydrogenase [Parasphingorhabdus sp.]|uniref:nucleotide sugar dehydrogenase n=1 Tax=Parasphingorhabdus sp. TaxID=2709688 RepID=UPI0032EA967E
MITDQKLDVLLQRIQKKEALIGVIGLGYVGLPICLAFAEVGARVLGFDKDPAKPASIARGETYLKQFSSERIAAVSQTGTFTATTDMGRLTEPDVILICVPTPLTKHQEPDLSFVVATAEAIAACLRPDQLIILESTSYPGTTNEVVKPIFERGGLKSGLDFFLAFSPEREDPGNEIHNTLTTPKVVGADDPASRALACAAYESYGGLTVPVSSSATAEAVKITENVFRAVNIALVNELKVVYSRMGIDVWEVIEAAKTKPFGYMPFYPGPGLGGHCIPIDPFYLTWKAREFGMSTRFIELAGQINTSMPDYVVAQLSSALDQRMQKGLCGSRILVIGIAYKKNIDDTRESPALLLIEKLEARSAMVEFYDPHCATIPMTREHASLAGRSSIEWDPVEISKFDAVLIVTDHDAVDYVELASKAKLVVDARNACVRAGADLSKVVPA